MRNDTDVVFGPNPLLSVDDIMIKSERFDEILFFTKEDQIGPDLYGETLYTIILGELDTIYLQGTVVFIDTKGCCNDFKFVEFKVDDEVICDSECKSLDIEICCY